MKNVLTLHEAIAVVLLSKQSRISDVETIADEINSRGLYVRKDNQPLPGYQVMQRTKLSMGRYHHLFEFIQPEKVRLI